MRWQRLFEDFESRWAAQRQRGQRAHGCAQGLAVGAGQAGAAPRYTYSTIALLRAELFALQRAALGR